MQHLAFKNGQLQARWEPLCQRVLEQFNLPPFRLLCYFDDVDYASPRQSCGGPFRGLSVPVIGSGTWPGYVTTAVFDGPEIAFDFLIYLPGRTCLNKAPLFVITFAHELQHFMHWGNAQKLWKANTLLYQHLRELDPGKQWRTWDIPAEREAMIVSKRVAENILGVEAVNKFLDTTVSGGNDEEEWKFFAGLSATATYDLLQNTIRLVENYRQQLSSLAQGSGVDFAQTEWWA